MITENNLEPIMVSIICLTYNQSKYIRDCLEGFVRQKTNFRFEAIVHDDASMDETPSVIRDYAQKFPDIIKPIIEEENQYSKHDGSLQRIINNELRGKYVALCEGDDYWIDPLKLQKQVDFLENNPEYGMCYTDFDIKNEVTGIYEHSLFKNEKSRYPSNYNLGEWIIKAGYVAPMTWVLKRELWLNLPIIGSPDGTYVRFASYLHDTHVYCLPDVTAVYRILGESASHTSNLKQDYIRFKSMFKTKIQLADLYLVGEEKQNVVSVIKNEYYNRGLKLFISFDDLDEIRNARTCIDNKSLHHNFLFLVSHTKLTRRIIRYIYYLYRYFIYLSRK